MNQPWENASFWEDINEHVKRKQDMELSQNGILRKFWDHDTGDYYAAPSNISGVIGGWMEIMQFEIPWCIRDTDRWRAALKISLETDDEYEEARAAIVMEWMWRCLVDGQAFAEQDMFGSKLGPAWKQMLIERSEIAAGSAARNGSQRSIVSSAAWSAKSALACIRTDKPEVAASQAAAAVLAVVRAHGYLEADKVLARFDPCGLLERLNAVNDQPTFEENSKPLGWLRRMVRYFGE